jgi:hypothetical protein
MSLIAGLRQRIVDAIRDEIDDLLVSEMPMNGRGGIRLPGIIPPVRLTPFCM